MSDQTSASISRITINTTIPMLEDPTTSTDTHTSLRITVYLQTMAAVLITVLLISLIINKKHLIIDTTTGLAEMAEEI